MKGFLQIMLVSLLSLAFSLDLHASIASGVPVIGKNNGYLSHTIQMDSDGNDLEMNIEKNIEDSLFHEFKTTIKFNERKAGQNDEVFFAPKRDVKNGFTVRVITDLNDDEFFQGASLFSKSLTSEEIGELFRNATYEPTGMTFTSVPSGQYIFVSNWQEPIDQMNNINHIICKHITINENTDIFISNDDPEYEIKFIQTLPNGEEVKLPNLVLLPDGNRERDWTNATIGNMMSKTYIVDPEWRDFYVSQGGANYECDGTYFPAFNIFDANAVHINSDVPESIFIVQTITLDDEHGKRYINHTSAKPALGSQIIFNDPLNYIKFVEPEHVNTPFGDEDNNCNPVLKYQEIFCGIASDYPSELTLMPDNETYFNVNPYYEGMELFADLRINYNFVEFEESVPGAWGTTMIYKDGIITPWLHIRDGRYVYDRFDRSEWSYLKGFLYDSVTEPTPVYWFRSYIGKETLMEREEDVLSLFGESAPYCVTSFASQSYDKFNYQLIYPTYFGYLGEIRTIDLHDLKITVNIDGNVEELNHSQYISWMNDRLAKENSSDISISFTNRNTEVEGLQAKNITTVSYDETYTDISIPMLNMLRFKDINGKITNSFINSEEGMMELYAGCFKQNFSEAQNVTWYEANIPSVKVEYSPYQQESYKELLCEEISELYLMPGFGHYYNVSLNDVNCTSPTKWYDLRLTISGGNSCEQTQIISPAFKVESPSGVDAVSRDISSVQVSGRNIIVPEGSIIFTTQGTMTGGRNVIPGIYLVKTPESTFKVTVK